MDSQWIFINLVNGLGPNKHQTITGHYNDPVY